MKRKRNLRALKVMVHNQKVDQANHHLLKVRVHLIEEMLIIKTRQNLIKEMIAVEVVVITNHLLMKVDQAKKVVVGNQIQRHLMKKL